MGFIQKDWTNPVSANATELNRIEKGIKDSHDNIKILSEELANLQLKQAKSQQDIQTLLSNSPSVLETITNLTALVSNNASLIQILQDTSNLVTQSQLNNRLNSFLHLTDIKQDGNSVVNGTEVNITTPTVDKILNRVSENAISNKAVTLALERLTSSIIIPTKLSDLLPDPHHLLVTEDEKTLWNRVNEISFTETDPTVPNWAKQPSKPVYEWIEILNRPEIHTQVSEFPDASNYARVLHDHDNVYAQLHHEHDDRYAQLIHRHLEYALASHNHDDLYAAKNHTHDFDTSEIEQTLADEIAIRSNQIQTLRDLIDSISMDYNDLQNLPDLTIYALTSDLSSHNHDTRYSLINHDHNSLYAALNHNHNSDYAALNHNHDTEYADITHNHDSSYAALNHNHDNVYSQLGHKHDLDYAALNHNHDLAYADINHNHDTRYSLTTHTHDYSSVYAAINHTHSGYAASNHTHSEFSDIVDSTTIQTMIDTSIASLINGAPTTLDTLKELADAISDNSDLITALNSAVTNHNHDTTYAALNHTHTVSDITDIATYYAGINHNHDTAYSSINHNHDTLYAAFNHNHDTEYASINSIPTVNDATLTVQLNGSQIGTFTANASSNKTMNIKALPNYSINIGSTGAGNPRQVKFLSVNYTNNDGNNACFIKLGAMCSHGNGTSYIFMDDIFIGVTAAGAVTCNVYKYFQSSPGTNGVLDNAQRYYGDVFWVIDTTNKVVDFYILCGQYSTMNFTPYTKVGATTSNGITQSSGTVVLYSSGTRNWANGNGNTYTTSGHNHDSTYLKLSGGTMTGSVHFGGGIGIKLNTASNHKFLIYGDGSTNNAIYTQIQNASDTVLGYYKLIDNAGKLYSNNYEVVNITDTQSIAGTKTFTGTVYVPDVTIS